MPKIADRVSETTTTTGTGTVTLGGAKTGYRSFSSAFSDADTVYYCITDGTAWEVGSGVFTLAGTTLSRVTVLASSNAGALVNFSSGTKDVFCTAPAVGIAPSMLNVQNKTAAYTVVAGDLGSVINCTSGSFTVSLTAAATLGSGFNCWVWNSSTTSTDVITIDPSGSETIDGVVTIKLYRGEGCQIVCDGTNWQLGAQKEIGGLSINFSSASTKPISSGANAFAVGHAAQATNSNTTAIGTSTTSSGVSSTAVGTSSSATVDYSTAVGYLANATGLRSLAVGKSVTASSANATAIGSNSADQGSQAVTGAGAMALAGSYASGVDSFAAAIGNNTSTYGAKGANSVALGQNCVASGANSVAIGGTVTASGSSSVAVGSNSTTASGSSAYAFGNNSIAAEAGKWAYQGPTGQGQGFTQTGLLVPFATTTNATPKVLSSNIAAADATNQLILPNNSAYAFDGIIVARQSQAQGTQAAAWQVSGLIQRGANAASTTLVTSTVTAISNVPGWTLALSADTTNGGLAVTFTGTAATNIRTVATLRSSEVIYA